MTCKGVGKIVLFKGFPPWLLLKNEYCVVCQQPCLVQTGNKVIQQQRGCEKVFPCACMHILYYVLRPYVSIDINPLYRSTDMWTVKSHLLVFLSRFFLSTSVQLKCQPVRTARYLLFPIHKLDSSLRSVSIWCASAKVSLSPVSQKTFAITFYTHNYRISEKWQQDGNLISPSVNSTPGSLSDT